jgi:Fic family protein
MIGELQGSGEHIRDLRLRRVNRLRSIQSSLAIENNSLSLNAVKDIISGKQVHGDPSEIQEVKNAYAAYERLPDYDPYSVGDFLKAHKFMTGELVSSAGRFRSEGVGVWDGKKLVHAGAHQDFVPQLIADLLSWAKEFDIHPLVKSSIVHFEIEFIHPFADGNGRMGRLWQTLILSSWNRIFEWLPVETSVHENQQGYYDALQASERIADSGAFIEFMLEIIYEAVVKFSANENTDKDANKDKNPDIITDIIPDTDITANIGKKSDKTTDINTDKDTDKLSKAELKFFQQIASHIEQEGKITNRQAQLLTNKSAESAKKYLSRFAKLGILEAVGENKGRVYVKNTNTSV